MVLLIVAENTKHSKQDCEQMWEEYSSRRHLIFEGIANQEGPTEIKKCSSSQVHLFMGQMLMAICHSLNYLMTQSFLSVLIEQPAQH